MIRYDTGGIHFLLNVCQLEGSVFPKALLFSIPSAIITSLFVYAIYDLDLGPAFEHFKDKNENVMNNNAIWGGFSFLVGFLVVFRTSQAYNRFWEGVTQTHKMGAEWFDACSSLVAFCKHSTVDQETILRFQNILVRLFSMLHAAALGEIEDVESELGYSEVHAFNMELIDAEAISDEALSAIRDSDAKVELIFQWIQQLVVENIRIGVLSIPPPILSRSFQEIAVGMVHFHEAMKISNVPFPFPYAQTCDTLLLLHWLAVPFVVCQWVTRPWWAGAFAAMQVFTLWTLNMIAVELENPFGKDPNDIDGEQMQLEFNNHLRLLLRTETKATPSLSDRRPNDMRILAEQVVMSALDETGLRSFAQIWNGMEERKTKRRFSAAVKKFVSRSSHDRSLSKNRSIGQERQRNKQGRPGYTGSMSSEAGPPSIRQTDSAVILAGTTTSRRSAEEMRGMESTATTDYANMRDSTVGWSSEPSAFTAHSHGSHLSLGFSLPDGIQGTWEPCGDIAEEPQGNLDVWEPDADAFGDKFPGKSEHRISFESKVSGQQNDGAPPGGPYVNDRNGVKPDLPKVLSQARPIEILGTDNP